MKFEATRGLRVHRRFIGIWPVDRLWYDFRARKWVSELPEHHDYSNCFCECRTVRAFRRHLRKHPELKGKKVTLVSRFVGHDVCAFGRG